MTQKVTMVRLVSKFGQCHEIRKTYFCFFVAFIYAIKGKQKTGTGKKGQQKEDSKDEEEKKNDKDDNAEEDIGEGDDGDSLSEYKFSKVMKTMLQLLASLGYKSVKGSPDTRDERESPSHNLILVFWIFPKLLFDTMRPMFQQSMNDIEMLCKKYGTYNSKSDTKRINAINPLKVSKWLNSSAKTPRTEAKWRKDYKKTHSLTSTDNIALDDERKACNFGASMN
jgi:hypothetical protein